LCHRNNISESIQNLLDNKSVFVYYKKPNTEYIKAITQKDQTIYKVNTYAESGFVFAPFDSTKDAYLIPDNKSDVCIFKIPPTQKQKDISSQIIDSRSERLHYQLVKKCILFIKEGKANKIVISHIVEKEISPKIIGKLFENLASSYPNAFVYLWHHPKVGLWIGATPEKLIYIDKDQYNTMALAGTQIFIDNLTWEDKEIEEQKWVSDYIYNRLKPLSNRIMSSDSYTHKAGHLAHIRTDIVGQLAKDISLKKLIDTLHPTPAVCGYPKDIAKDFILENEGYNRQFYTGFLGELNRNNKTELFVNLRCMQITDSSAKIYVGGGITKDSIPEKEWEETLYKAIVLIKFLNN
jgi:isochorismate synthase